jgi:glycosyltransferase involved in cell wall biosynthesis
MLSVVIPALNEAENIPSVLASIPVDILASMGWVTEVVIVDNGSTDGTDEVAREHGAVVVYQPVRGYGNAYRAGIVSSRGAVIATGDADCTYPFEDLPRLLEKFEDDQLDFLNTDRLSRRRLHEAMSPHHVVANLLFTRMTKILFRSPFRDSQSGMWIFTREFWKNTVVQSPGMAFSQEIKMNAHLGGFRVSEVPIDYRLRGGEKKLDSIPDAMRNLRQLFIHRIKVAYWNGRDRRTKARANATPLPQLARPRGETRLGAGEDLGVAARLIGGHDVSGSGSAAAGQ